MYEQAIKPNWILSIVHLIFKSSVIKLQKNTSSEFLLVAD